MSEIYSSNGSVSEELKLQALFFHGETEAWRRERYVDYRETTRVLEFLPLNKHSEEHGVAWIERMQVDPDTNEKSVYYHAACKCIALAEEGEDPDLTPMFECYTWQEGLMIRADYERRENPLSFGNMLGLSIRLDLSAPLESLDPTDEAILHELRLVKTHPERWSGNIRSGSHEIPTLSVVTDCEPAELIERAHRLHDKGWINFDGERSLELAA